mmetsp:Transcript_22655/g.43287  ORF Transcript_22655/g.43287 Transcript_22655/m.43287 type:complete len:228 (-) Transcript_22655:316-999(-)
MIRRGEARPPVREGGDVRLGAARQLGHVGVVEPRAGRRGGGPEEHQAVVVQGRVVHVQEGAASAAGHGGAGVDQRAHDQSAIGGVSPGGVQAILIGHLPREDDALVAVEVVGLAELSEVPPRRRRLLAHQRSHRRLSGAAGVQLRQVDLLVGVRVGQRQVGGGEEDARVGQRGPAQRHAHGELGPPHNGLHFEPSVGAAPIEVEDGHILGARAARHEKATLYGQEGR